MTEILNELHLHISLIANKYYHLMVVTIIVSLEIYLIVVIS